MLLCEQKMVPECVTDFLTTVLMSSVIYYWTGARQRGICLLIIKFSKLV